MKKDKQYSSLPAFLLGLAVAGAVIVILHGGLGQAKSGGDMTPYTAERFMLPDSRVVESVLPIIPAPSPESPLPPEPSAPSAPPESPAPSKPANISLRNDTSFDIDLQQLLDMGVRVPLNQDGVQVIIVHTHGTEAYTPSGSDTYTESDEKRTLDDSQNVLRVGEELKTALESHGIKAVHCTALCDYPNYSGAYDRSREAIEDMLLRYPEAKIIIDLHRDAVVSSDGSYFKATAQVDGRDAAQLLLVVGTDAGGLSHPNWRENMSFQLRLHQRIEELYPGLMRPINLRAARFNQHFRTGSMLLEVGTCANYLQEALYSVHLFANALADVLKNG